MQINHSKQLNKYSRVERCFTTKKGGNLAFHVNDETKRVVDNHDILSDYLNYETKTLVHMKQIHSDLVHIVDDADNFDNPPACDALITNKKNIPLMVMVADCAPVLFYDDKREVIAAAHAGRAGAFKNIVANVVESFAKDFHCDVKNVSVSVGPSIGVCCYEVGVEIYEEAKELKLDYAIERRNGGYYLNIRSVLKSQLLEAGVLDSNIGISSECNRCQSDKYFSYRQNAATGRFAGVIKLK